MGWKGGRTKKRSRAADSKSDPKHAQSSTEDEVDKRKKPKKVVTEEPRRVKKTTNRAQGEDCMAIVTTGRRVRTGEIRSLDRVVAEALETGGVMETKKDEQKCPVALLTRIHQHISSGL